jgi:SAM-dependent methyltransferase
MSWFEDWFNTPYYHILYKDRDFAEAENFITNLTQELQLPMSSKIIDLACGKGRHSVFLNKLGYDVLGVDLSKESISFAQKDFSNEHLQFRIHDMRKELYPTISMEKVDAVFNLFTSFGYFDDEEDDRNVFVSVENVLKENGVFILDFLNEKFIRNTLIESTIIRKGDIDFTVKKRIENNYIIKDIIFEDNGKKFHYFEKVKLNTLEQIEALAQSCGFKTVNIWGDYNLDLFNRETSPRCIFQFKK